MAKINKRKMKKRIGILTGGGDVQALNAVISEAKSVTNNFDVELIGFIKGWEGVLKENYIDLSTISFNSAIGGTILKTSRVNINKINNGIELVITSLKKNAITGLIVIGGEDTLSTAFLIKQFPMVLISKTIDNDVGKIENNNHDFRIENFINYFTLGFPTAAEKIVSFVSLNEGLRTTAYSHERIIIVEAMGMHAGWLALSSAIGYPDFIIIPEFPLNYNLLLEKIIKKYKSQKHLIIVVAEGAKWKDGTYIYTDIYTEKGEIEEFGHPRFGGSALILKNRLKKDLTKYFDTRNINSVNPSYLYRSGQPNELDKFWAQNLGETAVKYLVEIKNESCFLAIQKDKSGFKIQSFPLSKFNSFEELHRFVDERFYDPKEFRITEIGKKYLKEIVREIPLDESYGFEPISN